MVDEIDAEALHALLEADERPQVVDVRAPEQFARGSIPGSVNVPFERLLSDIDEVDWGRRVVFVCPLGERSRQAAQLLSAFEGIDDEAEIYNLHDGLQGWDGPWATPG
ncbi:MAG: rhodanese-like domain-containing protein [Halobacteriales archaeon]